MFKFSAILPAIGGFFKGIFVKNIPTLAEEAKTEFATVETSLISFAKTDLGKLAIDAVALVPNGKTNTEAFAAAKATFIADAKEAGHDLSAIGGGIVDWMIQTAYTYSTGVLNAAVAAGAK